jgi:diguanylate cyclase (GGDEF)-like protein
MRSVSRRLVLAQTRRHAWRLATIGGVAVTIGYFLLPPEARTDAYHLFALGAVVLVSAGVALQRPRARNPWLVLALGVAFYVLGDLIYDGLAATGDPGPTLADAAYLSGMALLIVATARLHVTSQRERLDPALLDAWLVAAAVGLLAWLAVIAPTLRDATDPGAAMVAAAYPVLDATIIGILAHHLMTGTDRNPSALLLVAGLAAFTMADLAFAKASLDGSYVTGDPIDAGWLLGYVAIAAAALHPAMARAPDPRQERTAHLGPGRLILIVAALSVVAVALVGMPGQTASEVLVSSAGALLIVGIVVARLLGGLERSGRLLREAEGLRLELSRRANTDALTGLPNRAAFTQGLESAIDQRAVGIIFIDLDGFKQVNDGYGHAAGDRLLVGVAERLRHALRGDDVVARLGGDEFGVLLAGGKVELEATGVAARLVEALTPPFGIGEVSVTIGASVGVAVGPRGGSAAELLREADVAMYEAKRRGGGVEVFEAGTHTVVMHGYRLASDLPGAIERDELELVYQPIVELQTRRIVALEALLRWRHPEEGLLPPSRFIPLAERSDLVTALDGWALRAAAAQLATWQRSGDAAGDVAMHVNISAHGLEARRADDAQASVRAAGIEPSEIVLEITETRRLERASARAAFEALRAIGFRVALDDFGSRYAVLAEIVELPVDAVKLDRTFVACHGDARRMRFMSGLVGALSSLGLDVIAEGLETDEDEQAASWAEIRHAQGYRFGRPVSASVVPDLFGRSAGHGFPVASLPAPA